MNLALLHPHEALERGLPSASIGRFAEAFSRLGLEAPVTIRAD